MKLKHFFTKQRYLILAIGLVSFVICILLAHHFSHDSETGVLFIDLAGSAVTIIATALAIEYLQFREKADKTRQVAAIAEEEIQAICYRVKLSVGRLYGYQPDDRQQQKLASLDDISQYLKQDTAAIDHFYKQHGSGTIKAATVHHFATACQTLQSEIENVINLFDYALPESLRASVLALRSCLQISERSVGFIHETTAITDGHVRLLGQLTDSVYSSCNNVLNHESRTAKNQPIAQKPSRVGTQQ